MIGPQRKARVGNRAFSRLLPACYRPGGHRDTRALPHFKPMDQVLLELIRQVPSAAAVIGAVYLFLKREKEAEEIRTRNAAALEDKRQAHDSQINNMWAGYIKSIIEQVQQGNKTIVDTIAAHGKESAERYEKLGITQDLIDAVKEQSRHARPR